MSERGINEVRSLVVVHDAVSWYGGQPVSPGVLTGADAVFDPGMPSVA